MPPPVPGPSLWALSFHPPKPCELTSWEIALWVVKAVRVGGPLEGVPWGEVILHEARREAVEVVGVWWLAELRMLLMWWERPAEGRWALQAEGWLTLASPPRRLLVLTVPGPFELAAPARFRLPTPGCLTLPTPAGVTTTLLAPHALVAVVPGWAVGWPTLVVWVRGLLRGLQGTESKQHCVRQSQFWGAGDRRILQHQQGNQHWCKSLCMAAVPGF